ncbi:MAG: ribosome biogenesis GTPase Der [Pseudomonadota bacterium]
MLPVIVLVGRPNVGKSTLFNRLTRSRDALVADQPGLTRDRKYGYGKVGPAPYVVVDTGGLSGEKAGIDPFMERQVLLAIDEADHILFLVDAKDGQTAVDALIAQRLRGTGKPYTLVVNKSESMDSTIAAADFFGLSATAPVPVSAAHDQGVRHLMAQVIQTLPPAEEGLGRRGEGVRVAVVGRPNVGKSTLVNRLLGEERMVAFDEPGTTRDSVEVPFERDGRPYVLVDTAGVRRRSRVDEAIEKFSVIKTLQAVEDANVVMLILDAHQGIAEQDATLAGHILDSGRALVVVVNKWDGLSADARERVRTELHRKLPFLDFARWHFVSALHGSGVGDLIASVDAVYRSAMRDLGTRQLNLILEQAVAEHPPKLVRGRRIKLRYAHQGGRNPPVIVIHGNQTDAVPDPYRRYLVNRFRKALKLEGTPIRVEFRTGENPYRGKRNPPTARQQRQRKRLMAHARKKK